MGVGDKLAALLKAKNKKPGTLASETGISKNTIYSIIKRNNAKVDLSIIERFAEALDVPIDYFFPAAGEAAQANHPNMLPVTIRRVPILGGAACGDPIYAPGDGTDHMTAGADDAPCDFALIARGDSMTGDRIHDGDVVFFRAQSDVQDGEIAAVAVDDGVTIKRVMRLRDAEGSVYMTLLISSNPAYAPIEIGGPGATQVAHIMGRAVAFKSLLNV